MTEEKLHKQTELNASADKSPENKRRRLIKGAVAIPVIMTLHSGAALAASSNLVGPVSTADAVTNPRELVDPVTGKVIKGDIICVKKGIESNTLENGTVDVGDDAYAILNPIKKKDADGNNVPDLEAQTIECLSDGNGIMVSSGAWSSLGPKINSEL